MVWLPIICRSIVRLFFGPRWHVEEMACGGWRSIGSFRTLRNARHSVSELTRQGRHARVVRYWNTAK
jgi:hypothetical protein